MYFKNDELCIEIDELCIKNDELCISKSMNFADPRHYDSGSTVTIDIMLSNPGSDYQGGNFQTLELDGELRQYQFEEGDALVFVSHKYHWCVILSLLGLIWGSFG